MNEIVKGSKLGKGVKKRRKPWEIYSDRRCEQCNVLLSKYNPGPKCYLHAPRRKPRIRGSTRD